MEKSNYQKSFTRNIGLLTEEEQLKLKNSCVAIAGIGGVGGFPAERLARLGIGHIKIADPETFTESDLNRQFGATAKTLGIKKVEVVSEILKEINPDIKVDIYPEGLNKANVDDFVSNVDLIIDAVEFFTFAPRLALYKKAREKGKYVILSGAFAFGSPLFVFSPDGMTMEDFFGLKEDQQVNFGYMLKKLTVRYPVYIDKDRINKFVSRELPASTVSPTCGLAGSLLAEESLFMLLDKRKPVVVPECVIIDLFQREFLKVKLTD